MRYRIMILALAGVAFAQTAHAQGHELYFHQTGALLQYTDAEVRLLWAALSSKEFDPEFTKKTVEELDKTLQSAKRNVDRITALLPDAMKNVEPDLLKLREMIKAAEGQLQKLATDIEEQTAPREEDEMADELEEAAGAPARDWELLKTGCAWFNEDVKAAKSHYAKLMRRMKVRAVRAPKRPKGKRK